MKISGCLLIKWHPCFLIKSLFSVQKFSALESSMPYVTLSSLVPMICVLEIDILWGNRIYHQDTEWKSTLKDMYFHLRHLSHCHLHETRIKFIYLICSSVLIASNNNKLSLCLAIILATLSSLIYFQNDYNHACFKQIIIIEQKLNLAILSIKLWLKNMKKYNECPLFFLT